VCVEVCVRVDWRVRGDLLEQVGEHQGGDGPHHGHLHTVSVVAGLVVTLALSVVPARAHKRVVLL